MTKPAHACDKPFPRHCPECGKVDVQPATIPYDAEVKHLTTGCSVTVASEAEIDFSDILALIDSERR